MDLLLSFKCLPFCAIYTEHKSFKFFYFVQQTCNLTSTKHLNLIQIPSNSNKHWIQSSNKVVFTHIIHAMYIKQVWYMYKVIHPICIWGCEDGRVATTFVRKSKGCDFNTCRNSKVDSAFTR